MVLNKVVEESIIVLAALTSDYYQRFTAFCEFPLAAQRISSSLNQQTDSTRHKFFTGWQLALREERFAKQTFKFLA